MNQYNKSSTWFDPLTQLLNRTQFYHLLDERIKHNHVIDPYASFYTFIIGLSGFKKINDSFGLSVGDAVLKEYSKRLEHHLAKYSPLIGRISGDEFIVVIDPLCFGLSNFHSDKIKEIFYHISFLSESPFTSNNSIFNIAQNIGVAIYPYDGKTTDELIKNADIAMYEAKKNNNNTPTFYSEQVRINLEKKARMEVAFSKVIENQELYLVFQPKIKIVDGKYIPSSAEVLCRWKSKELGEIQPSEFISLAEQNGMIQQVGKWIFHESVKKIKQWKKLGFITKLSINFSPKQLMNENIAKECAAIVKKNNIDPHCIIIEITEGMMMFDLEKSKIILNEFINFGFKISIDDFGKGYASLSYLKDFPIEEIKLDKSFIDNICHNELDQALVEGILGISKRLGIDFVAEGVETKSQLDYLLKHGCNHIQGYYFSKPLSSNDYKHFMQGTLLSKN